MTAKGGPCTSKALTLMQSSQHQWKGNCTTVLLACTRNSQVASPSGRRFWQEQPSKRSQMSIGISLIICICIHSSPNIPFSVTFRTFFFLCLPYFGSHSFPIPMNMDSVLVANQNRLIPGYFGVQAWPDRGRCAMVAIILCARSNRIPIIDRPRG